jgi:Cu2+-exporting ATPase
MDEHDHSMHEVKPTKKVAKSTCDCPPGECTCNHEHKEMDHSKMDHSKMDHSMMDHSSMDHSAHDPNVFKKQVLLATLFTIPAVYFSHTIQMLFGFKALGFVGAEYIPAAMGIALFFISGRVFLTSGLQEVKSKKPGMMALIALALVVSFLYSLFLSLSQPFGFGFSGMDFWWELATLILIMLVGHWLEMKAVMSASGALGELKNLIPDSAILLVGKKQKPVLVSEIKLGDKIVIAPGALVPVDGVVVSGSAKVNESMLTGEAALVEKLEGSLVFAGTSNTFDESLKAGSLVIEATATGNNTAFSQIVMLVEQAQKAKSKTQRLADRAAGWLFYVALGSAVITASYWMINGTQSAHFVLERVVTVLVIACPHALGLAIPLVTAITTAKAASSGLLIRNRSMFEQAAKLHAVLFDKTGTLTEGRRGVMSIRLASKSKLYDEDKVLALAAGVESASEHSIAKSIMDAADKRSLKLLKLKDFEALAGKGVSGSLGKYSVLVGSPALLVERNIRMEVTDLVWADQATNNGQSVICVVVDGVLEALLKVGDVIRPTSAEAVYELQSQRIRVGMLTGDAQGVANHVATELKISEVFAEALPWQKAETIKNLQAHKAVIGFVGDGVNDAPALAQADVSFAVGAGTNIAIETAGIVLLSSDPMAVVRAVRLSKRVRAKSMQNLWWAAGYNILAIPLAAGLFMPLGLVLTPALGAVLMSVSTLIVAINAQMLRRK